MDYQDSEVPPLSNYFGALDAESIKRSTEPHDFNSPELHKRLQIARAAMQADLAFDDEVPLFYNTPSATRDEETTDG